MDSRCTVRCENNDSEIVVVRGTTVKELLQYLPLDNKSQYISAYVNNKSKDLNYVINESLTVRFISYRHFEGCRVYRRTLIFMLYKAVKELFPEITLKVQFSVGQGAYFELEGAPADVDLSVDIRRKIEEYVARDIDIEREVMRNDTLIDMFQSSGQSDKSELLSTLRHLYYTVNIMDGDVGYLYGTLAASTGSIKLFNIERFYSGYVLLVPRRSNSEELEVAPKDRKIHEVFAAHKRWIDILDISTIGQLNNRIKMGDASLLVKVGEALQEKNISLLADKIYDKYQGGARVVMISGPSSSGKTTTSYRLSIQLRVLGLEPIVIGMDNYFVNRELTPLDDKGRYDYECLEAIDLEFFNSQLNDLIDGKEIDVPYFNFIEGRREFKGNKLRLKSNSIVVIEGIHALNPKTTTSVDRDKIFKLYVSALTSISMDNTSYISTTDNRLIRRIVRDNQFRGCSAFDTIKRWGSVRLGEERYIFPYQDEADYQFNSALFYELCVLKSYVVPLLMDVPRDTEEYSEAVRLRRVLEYVTHISSELVASNSLLKEFIGGSSFEVQ